MRELFSRLISVDAEAGGDIRVIEYFDRLVTADAGLHILLREAAMLSDGIVTLTDGGRTTTYDAAGQTDERFESENAVSVTLEPGTEVSIQQGRGGARRNKIIGERLALSIAMMRRGADQLRDQPSAVETLLAPSSINWNPNVQRRAMARIRIDEAMKYRAVCLPIDAAPIPTAPHSVILTERGPLWGMIVADGEDTATPAGVGSAVAPRDLPTSWGHAIVAMRLGDGVRPSFADSYGGLLVALAGERDADLRQRDVDAVRRSLSEGWSMTELQATADGLSLRASAAIAGIHHSTVRSRRVKLSDVVGFDTESGLGRHRLALAILFHRIDTPRSFDRTTYVGPRRQ